MKLKHGQKVIAYQATDYTGYKWQDNYLHPEITIYEAVIRDAMEEFRQWGGDGYLESARKLREATGNTFYIDLRSGFDNPEVTFRWQTDRRFHEGRAYYAELYACKIQACGFNLESLAIATKIAKLVARTWSCQPLQIVAALEKLKAVRCVYSKLPDRHIITEHLTDNLFGLPAEQRAPEGMEAA
jgi:hypothetical protein